MDRTACVSVPALPLQLLLREHADWDRHPAVVVDRDKPQGVIQWANDRAHAQRIVPGMRYAVALSLARELRGGVVTEAAVDAAVAAILHRLWSFSPRVEPSPREPGVFWLDASGLGHVFASLELWAECIRGDLRGEMLRCVTGVGFTRFGSYAAAKANPRDIVFQHPAQERAYLRDVPIACLTLDTALRDTLFRLGIESLGGFLDLPAAGIRKRFGEEAGALHVLARGDAWTPLAPERILEPIESREALDYPEENIGRLLPCFARMLHALLPELAARHEAVKSLRFSLLLDDGTLRSGEIAPATPTRDANQLYGLIRLRIETVSLGAPVVELGLHVVGIRVSERQVALFQEISHQRIEAAEQAFAKIRAQLGNDAVVHARLHEGHLPEARYGWETLGRVDPPRPGAAVLRPMIRRLYTPPIALPPRDRYEPDGWLIAGIAEGPVEEVIGPQTVSGGWWMGEISRAYHYVRTRSGRWLWIYYDHKRRRWFLQGEVQ